MYIYICSICYICVYVYIHIFTILAQTPRGQEGEAAREHLGNILQGPVQVPEICCYWAPKASIGKVFEISYICFWVFGPSCRITFQHNFSMT